MQSDEVQNVKPLLQQHNVVGKTSKSKNYGKNKQYCNGHVTKEGNYWFVNLYTCNGRCITIEDKHSIIPEIDKCCENIKFLLDEESQNKVTYHDLIYFEILDSVENPFNNWIGLYAKYIGHSK